MNREIKWLGDAPQVGVGYSFLSSYQIYTIAYQGSSILKTWSDLINIWDVGTVKLFPGDSACVDTKTCGTSWNNLLQQQWSKAKAAGATKICMFIQESYNNSSWKPLIDGYGKPVGKICYDGVTVSLNVATNTPVTVNTGNCDSTHPCPAGQICLNGKCTPAPRQKSPPVRVASPYTQTFHSIYGTPEQPEDGTLGQTRYQEYDPRTGAAIGEPMSEAEFHSRGGLRRFPIVRLVVIPNIPNYTSSYCTQLYGKANYAYQMYEELVKTYAILQKEGIQPYADQAMQTAIQNAYASFSSLWELGRQLGCTWWKPLRA